MSPWQQATYISAHCLPHLPKLPHRTCTLIYSPRCCSLTEAWGSLNHFGWSWMSHPGTRVGPCSLFPAPVSVNPHHDQSHKGKGSWVHSPIPCSPIAAFKRSTALNWSWPLRSSEAPLYTTVFIRQKEDLWPNESLWHTPKTHNDIWDSKQFDTYYNVKISQLFAFFEKRIWSQAE